MKIKLIAFAMVLVLVIGMLAACRGDGDGGDDEPVTPPGEDIYVDPIYNDIYWDETTLIYQMTQNSNGQELPSSCARYLAGNTEIGLIDDEVAGDIDDMVDERNENAETVARVNIKYDYLPDDGTGEGTHGWGKNIDEMVKGSINYTNGLTPDIYCNFVYDMVCASLQSAFANLWSSTVSTQGKVKNYFRFTDPKFEDLNEGFMYDYMRSLSLSRNKMYCLSSDYYVDMVRAFFVVPVNIGLLNTIPVDPASLDMDPDEVTSFNGDRNGDGIFDVSDFYDLVWDGQWSYQTLADISKSGFYSQSSQANPTDDPNGCLHDRLIFALDEDSGLSASGMLYTTSVTVIVYEWGEKTDGVTGEKYTDYVYEYPDDNPDLYNFCKALKSLMSENKGIVSISSVATKPQTLGYGGSSLLAIRDRFVNDSILFGGAICLGSLEYKVYKDMEGGFGILPVPLYQLYKTDEDGNQVPEEYLTQIHNIGRIGAIRATTDKFAMCTAYLNYLSENSAEILDEYYNYKLTWEIANGGHNQEMLQYIRKHVRTSFDKVFEDAIGRLFATANDEGDGEGTSSEDQKWHVLIKNAHYEIGEDGMTTEYRKYIEIKITHLKELEESYVGLPK